MRDIVIDATDIWPDYRPTRLVELPALARAARVGRVIAKLEGERPLGNFKALGGMVAGLSALARVAEVSRLRELRQSDLSAPKP
jgi:diaminopropionate ammonia-lyase